MLLAAPNRLRRSKRVERPLKLEPRAAPEVRAGSGDAAAGALGLALEGLLGVGGFISHLQLLNGRAAARVTRTLAPGVESPSHTVLVVDDDASIRFLCRVNLELEGWAVREAATLAQARVELEEGEIDIALLDVHVGGDSGVDFLAEVRARYPGLPVAMLTGSVGSPTLAGVETDAVIPKPFTLDQLTETVRTLAPRTAPSAG